ncbi:50S ribosomal protein L22 [Candidatus Walczuchella endosymbiont of Icerya purchasi]|uniref:50S ribosomal protein L22 n=1 Tax=Candidatus Walczuchella endosymbiont of Icerya purchasi TaxID=3066219 RepID=UPI00313C4C91
MGSRKRISAISKRRPVFACLNNVPISARKMRLIANLIRNLSTQKALEVVQFNKKHASIYFEKLILSAMANWINNNTSLGKEHLYISRIYVDSAHMLKRVRAAPQGRSHQIRKRSNHVSIFLYSKNNGE